MVDKHPIIIKVFAVLVKANNPEHNKDIIAIARFAVKYLSADILGLIPLLVKLFKYLVINPKYGPFTANCIENNNTIKIKDENDNLSCPINPINIQDNTKGIPKYVKVLFLKLLCILSVCLVANAATNCKIANIIPKYCSGTFISLNMLLLKLTIPYKVPMNTALNKIKFLIRFDFMKNLKDSFNCFLYSVNVTGLTFSCNIVVCLNLNEIMVDITQQIKHRIIGMYPFITNEKPAITEATESKI